MAIFPASGIAGLLGRASPYGAPLRQAAPTADQAVNQVQLLQPSPGSNAAPTFLGRPSIVSTGDQLVEPAAVPQDLINSYAAMSPEDAAFQAQMRLAQRDVKPPAVQKFLNEVARGNYDFSSPMPDIVDTYQGPMGSPLSSVDPDYTGFVRQPTPSMNVPLAVPLAYDSFPVNRPSPDDFPMGLTGGGGLRPPPGGLFGFPGFPPPSDPPNTYPGYGGGSTGGGGGLMAEIPKAIEPVIQNASRSLNTGIGQIISKTMGTGGPSSGPNSALINDIGSVRSMPNMPNLLLEGLF